MHIRVIVDACVDFAFSTTHICGCRVLPPAPPVPHAQDGGRGLSGGVSVGAASW